MNALLELINPMSFNSGPGIRVEVLISNTVGLEVNPKDMVDRIRKFRPYFGPDGGGVTFKGALLENIAFLKETCRICHKAGINTCIELSAKKYQNDKELFKDIDLIILSLDSLPLFNYNNLSIEELMNINQFINDASEYKIDIWIKQFIKHGVNDTIEYIECLNKYLRMYNNIRRIELLSEDILLEELKNKLKEVYNEEVI